MNRFEGYDREEDLMKNGLKLMAENKLWAALVFTNTGGPNSTEIPKFIRYKIRMDAQKVDSTKRIEDRQVVNKHLLLRLLRSAGCELVGMRGNIFFV